MKFLGLLPLLLFIVQPQLAEPTRGQIFVIRVGGDNLEHDRSKNIYIYHADSNAKRASYNHYIFTENEFEKKTKGQLPVKVKVRVLEVKTSVSSNPGGQEPEGGFRHSYVKVTILQVIP